MALTFAGCKTDDLKDDLDDLKDRVTLLEEQVKILMIMSRYLLMYLILTIRLFMMSWKAMALILLY